MLSPVRLSVCPSVRPSVCLSDGWIIQKRLKLELWSFHHTVAASSSFSRASFIPKFWGVPQSGALNEGRVGKIGDFWPLNRHISKTVRKIGLKLLLITNRNVYTRFSLVQKSMTLSDPWPGFQGHGRQNWRFSAFKPPISQKRFKLGSCNFHRTVAPSP